jgi:predicted Zn-dependent protease
MSSTESKDYRSWQEIAAEASQERDPQKLVELIKELERALDARDVEMRGGSQSAHQAAP